MKENEMPEEPQNEIEEVAFSHRAIISRCNSETEDMEPMGKGIMNIFYAPDCRSYRLFLRDEKTNKIVCNMQLTMDVEVRTFNRKNRTWRWKGNNLINGVSTIEDFSVYFEKPDISLQFYQAGNPANRKPEKDEDQRVKLYEGPATLMYYGQLWDVIETGTIVLILEPNVFKITIGYYTKSKEYRCFIFPSDDYSMYLKKDECYWRAKVADSDSTEVRWCGLQLPNEENARDVFFYLTFPLAESKAVVLKGNEKSIDTKSAQGKIGFIKKNK